MRARIHLCLCLCLPSANALAARMLQNANKRQQIAAWKNGNINLVLPQFLVGPFDNHDTPTFSQAFSVCGQHLFPSKEITTFIGVFFFLLLLTELYVCVLHSRVCLLLWRTGEPCDTDPCFMGYVHVIKAVES